MRSAFLAALAALALSGCLDPGAFPGREAPDPDEWEVVVEPSMAPDFRGTGESYPVLLVHQHHVPSQRQVEERARNPVVCLLAMDGTLLGTPAASDAMAPCVGPSVDPPTGRLFAERKVLQGARGVVAYLDSCSGGFFGLDGSTREFRVATPRHEFVVRLLDNGTFAVDGRWIEPGTTLKVGYYVQRGSATDEEYVRVAFDAPGEWLWSRVRPRGDDPGVPPRPDQGSGLVLDVPLAPETPRDVVAAVVRATPGHVEGLLGLRAVHDGARLTEATVALATDAGTITWYGAGRTQGALRLLGAIGPSEGDGVGLARVEDALGLTWDGLRAGAPGRTTDVRLATQAAWETPAGLALGIDRSMDPVGCAEGCVLVKSNAAWHRLLAPQERVAQRAATLHVLAFEDAEATHVWWHAPGPPGSGTAK